MTIERFEDIEGWKLGRQLCQQVFELSETGTLGKDFSLKDQMFRSSGSIMDNVAEGFDAGSNPDFMRFMQYSKRSCSEVQSQLYRCLDRRHITQDRFETMYERPGSLARKSGRSSSILNSRRRRKGVNMIPRR